VQAQSERLLIHFLNVEAWRSSIVVGCWLDVSVGSVSLACLSLGLSAGDFKWALSRVARKAELLVRQTLFVVALSTNIDTWDSAFVHPEWIRGSRFLENTTCQKQQFS
jgi:hypothetical protein